MIKKLKYKKLTDNLYSATIDINVLRTEPIYNREYSQGRTLNGKLYSHTVAINDSEIWVIPADETLDTTKKLFVENLLLTCQGKVETTTDVFTDFIIDPSSIEKIYIDDMIDVIEYKFKISFVNSRTLEYV